MIRTTIQKPSSTKTSPPTQIRSVLITGANSGLGFECAKQLAERNHIEKIYLGCRSQEKANLAKSKLEKETNRSIFEVVLIDTMNHQSVRNAVSSMKAPVDAVVLNAGGIGGSTPYALTSDGVTHIFATNVLGHVVLVDEMIKQEKIASTILYAGSEAVRGIPTMGIAKPKLSSFSVEEFESIANGTKFPKSADPLAVYGEVKLVATYWMAFLANKYPHFRFLTVSPGGTSGTNGMDDLPFLKKIFFKYVGGTLMPMLGMMHHVEKGAKRYVDALTDSRFASGKFYASKSVSPTGPMEDQSLRYEGFDNPEIHRNAKMAIERFL